MASTESGPSMDELNSALRTVMNLKPGDSELEESMSVGTGPVSAPAVAEPEVEAPEAAVEPAPTSTASEPAEVAGESQAKVEESADLVALRDELASTRKKAAESLGWARDLALRKGNEAQQYRALLEKARSEAGVERAELDRMLGQPAGVQAQYPAQQALQPTPQDDMAQLDTQQFLFDKGLGESQAKEFETWLRSPDGALTEREIVPGNTYATLALAHARYSASRGPNPMVVEAAKTVSRTQRAVARAASAQTGRAAPTPAPAPEDPMSLTPAERQKKGYVDQWFNSLMDSYR